MASMQRTAPAIEDLEALRGPLTGYCYRMLGCAADTDDAVQETVIRAYRHLDQFDPARARLSTWMYGIATNICLDMLRGAQRRALLAPVPPSTPGGELGAPAAAERWLEPMPDSRTIHAADPPTLRSSATACVWHSLPRCNTSRRGNARSCCCATSTRSVHRRPPGHLRSPSPPLTAPYNEPGPLLPDAV